VKLAFIVKFIPVNAVITKLKTLLHGIILSGGPDTVTSGDTPRAPHAVFELGVPVLGICYGYADHDGNKWAGKVENFRS